MDFDFSNIEMGEARVAMRETETDVELIIIARFPDSAAADMWMLPLFTDEQHVSVH